MWLILAFLTALFTSLHDVVGKKILHKADVTVVAWAWVFFSLPYIYVFLLIDGIPPLGPSFFGALTVSSVILIYAALFYFKAIKYSDLSICVPMLAFSPLFLLVTSPLILGEFPAPAGLFGVLLIVAGSYALNVQERSKGYFEPIKHLFREKGPRYMLLVAAIYSIGANFDKIGVTNSSPVMWAASVNTVLSGALGLIMLRKHSNVLQQVSSVWPMLSVIGLFYAVALICQMIAIEMVIVPYLIAIKRTSIFMTSLFGFLLFKEKGMKERLIGALLIISGVFMITLFQ